MSKKLLTGVFLCVALVLPATAVAAKHGAYSHRSDVHLRHARRRHHRRHHRHALRHAVLPHVGEATTTVASFEGGVLTLTLASGQNVSGMVGEHTLILCPPKEEVEHSEHEGWFPPVRWGPVHPDWSSPRDGYDWAGRGGWYPHPQLERCGTTGLVKGAKVGYALLSISSSGAEWSLLILAA